MAVQEPNSRAYLAGQFFKHYRKLHNLTQEQFARDLGIEPRALRAYENAERPLRDVDELQRIADFLGEAARDSTPLADAASRGNGIQLLGRAYLQVGNLYDFERTMAEAEKIASTIEQDQVSTHGQYSVGAVLEEYGRGYGSLGQMQRAPDYVDRAEASLPLTVPWKICLTATRAMSLVRGGEYGQGLQLAEAAADLCQAHKNFRLLERV